MVCKVLYLLLQDVVKSGSPFSASQARCVGAVIHHEGHSSCMHVGVQRVNSLQALVGRHN
jgi:hypothetical protein